MFYRDNILILTTTRIENDCEIKEIIPSNRISFRASFYSPESEVYLPLILHSNLPILESTHLCPDNQRDIVEIIYCLANFKHSQWGTEFTDILMEEFASFQSDMYQYFASLEDSSNSIMIILLLKAIQRTNETEITKGNFEPFNVVSFFFCFFCQKT